MKSTYSIQNGQLMPSADQPFDVIQYSSPTDSERENILQECHLDAADLESIFDPDEVPRLEYSQERLFIIWKRPDNASLAGMIQFEVSSLGLFLVKNRAVLVSPAGEVPLSGREFKRVTNPVDFLLRVMLSTIRHYQGHLKAIKIMSTELEAKLVVSMENKYLLQMFTIGESLVYYHNALEGNATILAKLRSMAEKLNLTPDQIELLDDITIENQQASKQASIYSSVLSGLMDARGTIINNNMNVLLKNLTIINVVFMPLNLIASIGGMSEYSMMTRGIDWRISYAAFSIAMVIIGWLTWWWLVKVVDRKQGRYPSAHKASAPSR